MVTKYTQKSNLANIQMTKKIVVFSTCGSAEEAESLARSFWKHRLAACVA